MKKKVEKLFKGYKKLDQRSKIQFKHILNRDNEIDKLRNLEERALIAQTIQQSLQDIEGRPYLNVDWIAKNVMKLTDDEIKENRTK